MPKGDREIMKADCEDGYTRIANLILEAIPLARLSGVQTGICLFLWRRSYGWNKEDDAISLGEFAAACGTSKAYISRQLADLIDKNIIERRAYQPGRTPVYAFITSIAQWCKGCINVQGLHENTIQGLYICTTEGLHKCATLNQKPDQALPKIEPSLKTERKTIKENIYSPESIQFELAQLLLLKIKEHLPNHKKPDLQKWAQTMDAMLRLDKRDPEEVKEVISYAQDDLFWQANVLSVDKLRQHYDRLNLRRTQTRAGPGLGKSPPHNVAESKEKTEYLPFFKGT